jgi:hypothetical protein
MHALLLNWSRMLKAQFQLDNLHLTSSPSDIRTESTAALAQSLGQSMALLHSAVNTRELRLKKIEKHTKEVRKDKQACHSITRLTSDSNAESSS